jgi:16S rRNA (guanine527-N7)-methyltransferase
VQKARSGLAKHSELPNVSRETIERCEALQDEVRKWQRTTNLVAPSTLDDMWDRHIVDSLQLAKYLTPQCRILDIGSGGGFPALPLAVWQALENGGSVTAVESNRKKTAFLRQTAHKLNVSSALTVRSERIESVDPAGAPADFVTARALASLDLLLSFVEPWSSRNSLLKCLFHKGREYHAEVDACRGSWTFDLIEHESITSPDARVLEISNVERKADIA